MRLAFAVADSWKKFGVDVTVKQLESAPFNAAFRRASTRPTCTGRAAA